jgi:translocator protein
MSQFPFRPWHAILLLVAVNVISAVPAGFQGDEAFYNNFELPRVAPPDWLFPPMWLFLNVTSMIALYRVTKRPASDARRRVIIGELIGWVLFASFSTLYFWLQSPILGAAETVVYALVTAVSAANCLRLDRGSALLLAPRLAWLCLASYVSVYGALFNLDPFFQRLGGF